MHTRTILYLIGESIMKKHKTEHLFLKGPLKFDWLSKAYKSGPNSGALAVSHLLVMALDMQGGQQPVSVSSRTYKSFGMERGTFQKALQNLKEAGLITYTPENGKSHRVTVLQGYKHVDNRGAK